jgi:hypothetical protein
MNKSFSRIALLLGWWSALMPLSMAQDTAAEKQFQRGFFLQVHEHDLKGALEAYRAVVADTQAPAKLRQDAERRVAETQEDLASANLARLMPPDCLAYAEIAEPGQHVGRILNMMGLLGSTDGAPSSIAKPGGESAEKPVPLGGGIYLPSDLTVSPALVTELQKFRGVAVGLTAVEQDGRPAGLVVLHPGDCDLVRGALETAVQLLQPGDPIEGFKTYRIPDVGWVLVTTRMLFLSDSRDQLIAAIERIRNPQAASLAGSESFQRAAADAKGSLLFAFVDGPKAVKRLSPMLAGQEAAIVRTLLDPEHIESLTVALTTSDAGIHLRVRLSLMSGHHNMIYALIRTAPITKRSLEHVPQGAAGVLLVGLNPADQSAPSAPAAGAPPSISAMDIGREFFHNIEEVAVFALAPSGTASRAPIPEIGAVIAVKDAAKSEALWNQILMLVALAGKQPAKPPTEITLEGKSGRTYQFEGLPSIAVVRAGRELVIGTEAAVAASLKASASQQSIAQDAACAPLIGRLTPDTSKALLVDVGRAVDLAAGLSRGRQSQEMKQAGALVRDLKFSILTDEAPNQLTLTAELTGLPKFRDIVSMLRAQSANRPTVARE